MPLRLISQKTLPKDGFIVTDPTTGRRFGGQFSFSYVSTQLLAYRIGNNLPGATRAETDEELDRQTCLRDPSLCFDSSIRVSAQVRSGGGCGSCGIVTT